jgi:hypothetical protein
MDQRERWMQSVRREMTAELKAVKGEVGHEERGRHVTTKWRHILERINKVNNA